MDNYDVARHISRISDPRRLHAARRAFNDQEREIWVSSDDELYLRFVGSRQAMRQFLRENRAEIDAWMREAIEGDPA